MRTIVLVGMLALACSIGAGCGKVGGPRFWWDDRSQARLSDEYALPDDPGAPAEAGFERGAEPSGEDLSADDLRDYRTNLDQEEEKRKSESSLLDF